MWGALDTETIIETLAGQGLIEPDGHWSLTRAIGGLNSRVYRLHSDNAKTAYTVRTRDTGTYGGEIEALTDVAGCPGVPDLAFADDRMLVHGYLEGKPQPLTDVDPGQIGRLAVVLNCLHQHTYEGFTPWPDRSRVEGTRADLYRFRVGSLKTYASYPLALRGDIDPRLPELVAALDAPAALTETSWGDQSFSRLHGDLSIGNILWKEDDVALIDWEYSRIGDPAEELAYLLTEQPVEATRVDVLRAAYIEAGGDPDTWRRVPTYALYTSIDSALWWADYGVKQNKTVREEVATRVETTLGWLASSRR
ncbi:hypothetical protein BH23CHL2_BH23CHL2_07440 [soil metagenome]